MRRATWGLVLGFVFVGLSAQGQLPPRPGLSPGDPPTPCVSINVRVPAQASADADLTYRITIENTTEAPAHHVLVRCTLPKNARFVRGSPAPDGTTPVVLWKIGTLAAGKKAYRTLVVKPEGDADLNLCARVQFEHGQCVRTRIVRPGLQVRRTGPTEAAVDEDLHYRLEVTNNGTGTARDVVLLETLPKELRFINTKTPTKGDNPLDLRVGDIPPGGSRTVEYMVHVLEAGTFTIKGEARAAGGFSRPISPTTVTVKQKGAEVQMFGPTGKIKVNATARFRIVITNPGSAAATNVRLTNELPAEITFVGSTGGGKFESGVVRWDIGTIPAGGKREVTLDVSSAQAGTFTNVCHITADGGLREQGKATASFIE
jgi:uncharacterized repeat protein (TIGR01451 family)